MKRRARWSPFGPFALWLVAALLAAAGPGTGAETHAKAPRLTVAVLTFEDQTANPEAAHWRHNLQRMLDVELGEVKAVKTVPAAFGYRQLKLKPGVPISADQARKIGELIEARRVVWGSYRREGQQWLVTRAGAECGERPGREGVESGLGGLV